MYSSRQLLGQVRRALALATVLSAASAALLLVVPLLALHALDAPPSAASLPTQLWAVTGSALLGALALAHIRAVVLARAGLWLQHTMTRWLIETASARGATARDLQRETEAAAIIRAAIADGLMWPLPALVWALSICAMVYLVAPMGGLIGGVIVLSLAVLIAAGAAVLGLAPNAGAASEKSARWLDAITRPRAIGPATIEAGDAARQWAAHDAGTVSRAYARSRRLTLIRTLARGLPLAGLLALCSHHSAWSAAGNANPGLLVACAALLGLALAPLIRIAIEPARRAAARQAWAMLAATAEAGQRPPPIASPVRREGIVLDDASWTYRGARKPAVAAISLSIAPGESIGIIGPEGAGKSALAALIASAGASQGRVGYLTDTPMLFEGTVRANIAGFDLARAPDVERSVALAGMFDCIEALPNGLESEVGEDGSKLPMRTRRGIALARALCGAPRLVVLDEPELGLDDAGVDRLARALQHIRASGATLVIATRVPRLLQLTNRIVLLEAGRIAGVLPSQQVVATRAYASSTVRHAA